ncbi:hypothetical protein Tco_1380315, partial [Tanacetum coccineum]
ALKHIGQSGRAFNTSPSLSFFDNLTAPSHSPDDGGDDVTYIGQQFTTDFPIKYNVDPRKVVHEKSSTKELFTPFMDSERGFRSSRKHFKTLSLDELRSPNFDLFPDKEE